MKLSKLALTKEQIFTTPALKKLNFIDSTMLSSRIKSRDIEPKKCKILYTDIK